MLKTLAVRLPKRPATYAGAALAAAMAAIVVNATALQPERLPAPFFAAAKPATPVVAATPLQPAVAAPSAPPTDAAQVAAAPQPPIRPQPTAAANAAPPRQPDRIAELLRAKAGKDGQRVVSTTQAALVKLGYSVKVTGGVNAETLSALREFEKQRNLPASTEITPRLAKIVLAAANERGVR